LFVSVLAHQMMTCSDTQILEAFRIFDKEGRGTIGQSLLYLLNCERRINSPDLTLLLPVAHD